MLRRLLACLALLTGLAAAGAPAQAEAMALAARVEASASGAGITHGQAKSAVSQPSLRREYGQIEVALPGRKTVYAAPATWQRSDRARE